LKLLQLKIDFKKINFVIVSMRQNLETIKNFPCLEMQKSKIFYNYKEQFLENLHNP